MTVSLRVLAAGSGPRPRLCTQHACLLRRRRVKSMSIVANGAGSEPRLGPHETVHLRFGPGERPLHPFAAQTSGEVSKIARLGPRRLSGWRSLSLANLRLIQPGQALNPSGRPKVPAEVRKAAMALTPEAIR